MNVYIVVTTLGLYDMFNSVNVFRTKEDADNYVKNCKQNLCDDDDDVSCYLYERSI